MYDFVESLNEAGGTVLYVICQEPKKGMGEGWYAVVDTGQPWPAGRGARVPVRNPTRA